MSGIAIFFFFSILVNRNVFYSLTAELTCVKTCKEVNY